MTPVVRRLLGGELVLAIVCAGCGPYSAETAHHFTNNVVVDASGAAGTTPPSPNDASGGAGMPVLPVDAASDIAAAGGAGSGGAGGAILDAGAADGPLVIPPPEAVVDATSLNQKMLFGYQGWFACAGDGSPVNSWEHWFKSNTPSAAGLTIDLWPDTSELDADELFPTQMKNADGSTARLYSAYTAKTVARHFAWMKQAGIDGVSLQRFLSEVQDANFFMLRNQVARNVQAGAEANGRVFAIEYDITSVDPAHLIDWLETDWMYLVDTLKVTSSARYLHDGGKPVLYLWGIGFTDRPGTPAQFQTLIDWLTTSAPAQYRVTLVGGVPTHWRTLTSDSQTDPAWAPIYRSLDVISPWTVGRYVDAASADSYRTTILAADLTEAKTRASASCPSSFPASPGITSAARWRSTRSRVSAANSIGARCGTPWTRG